MAVLRGVEGFGPAIEGKPRIKEGDAELRFFESNYRRIVRERLPEAWLLYISEPSGDRQHYLQFGERALLLFCRGFSRWWPSPVFSFLKVGYSAVDVLGKLREVSRDEYGRRPVYGFAGIRHDILWIRSVREFYLVALQDAVERVRKLGRVGAVTDLMEFLRFLNGREDAVTALAARFNSGGVASHEGR